MFSKLVKVSQSIAGLVFPAVLYYLSYITPRFNKIWVIGNRLGQNYLDNPKYLYEYLNSHEKKIKAIWLTANDQVYSYLKNRGLPVYKTYSFWGYFYSLIAKVALVSVVRRDINQFCIAGAQKITLHHGTYLKLNTIEKEKPLLERIIYPYNQEYYDYGFVTFRDEKSVNHYHINNHLDPTHILVTGYPRNDIFLSKNPPHSSLVSRLKKDLPFKHLVLYAPTFRNNFFDKEYDLFFKYGWDVQKIDNILKQHNAILLIKLHFHHKVSQKLIDSLATSHRVILFNTDDPLEDNYILFRNTDILITDYSSLYLDYLLLDKPVIFTPFDYEYYKSVDCSFSYNYHDVTPGPKAKNWPEIYKYLGSILNGKDLHRAQRHQIRDRFNFYRDGKSAQRVTREIKRIIGIK